MKLDTDVGRLDKRIVIQKHEKISSDKIGNQTSVWTDYHKCWAEIKGLYGREYWAAREQHEENTVTFKIRYCKKLKELNTFEFRILFNGKIYDIQNPNNLQFADSLLLIKATERSCNNE